MQTTYLYQPIKTKKAVKEAIARGERLEVYAPNPWSMHNVPPDGRHTICGPGPYDRRWYGQVTVKDGLLTSIK